MVMHGIKIPQYEFALKMQGGLCARGGRICGTLRYVYLTWKMSHISSTSPSSTELEQCSYVFHKHIRYSCIYEAV